MLFLLLEISPGLASAVRYDDLKICRLVAVHCSPMAAEIRRQDEFLKHRL